MFKKRLGRERQTDRLTDRQTHSETKTKRLREGERIKKMIKTNWKGDSFPDTIRIVLKKLILSKNKVFWILIFRQSEWVPSGLFHGIKKRGVIFTLKN